MDLEQVTEHINLLQKLNRKQVFDLLFNLGHVYKDFKELLSITHIASNRRILLRCRDLKLVSLGEAKSGSMKVRVDRLLNGGKALLNSYEYCILYTLIDSPYITASIRDNLKDSLVYVLESSTSVHTQECSVCSYIGSSNLCLSCRRNILSFLKYRRESFILPIDYINFNIRGHINMTGEFTFIYKDWELSKNKGTIRCKLLGGLPEDSEPIQYELPFVELQRPLS